MAVEEVPGVVGLVAGELEVPVLEELLLELLVLVGAELVVGVELVLLEEDEEELLELLELLQSLAASWATVLAPWLRFCDRVVLTVEGRLVTALVSAAEALSAEPH